MTNILLQQAKTAQLKDQTQVTSSGPSIPEAGKTLARFIGYVEAGMREGTFKGQPNGKKSLRAYLFFELLGAKHIIEDDEHGTYVKDGKKYRTTLFRLQTDIKLNERANFRKLFMKMRNGREDITHTSQLLSEPYIITITHNSKGEGEQKKTYANMRNADGEWGIAPPLHEDAVSGEVVAIPVPEPTRPYQLLLWDHPTKEQWDSIFIDGTTTRKNDKGEEVEVSRNWLQNEIVSKALDYEGSAVHDLLDGIGGLTLDADAVDDTSAVGGNEDEHVEEEVKKPAEEPAPETKEPVAEKKAAEPVKEAKPADDDATTAALRELGLV